MEKKLNYTIGEVAILTGMSYHTVKDWIKQGLLQCFRLPTGRNETRIKHEDLLTFSAGTGVPVVFDQEFLGGREENG